MHLCPLKYYPDSQLRLLLLLLMVVLEHLRAFRVFLHQPCLVTAVPRVVRLRPQRHALLMTAWQ